MPATRSQASPAAGFSIPELLVAMAITLIIMGIASSLLAASFHVREREDRRSDAIADVQRALAIMTREIANAGFPHASNGIVPGDSDTASIRIRADLNEDGFYSAEEEDVKYSLYINDPTQRRFLIRHAVNGQTEVLANRVDSLQFTYQRRDPVTGAVSDEPGNTPTAYTVSVVISLNVVLPAVGRPGSPGHQPETLTRLESQVSMRNANLWSY